VASNQRGIPALPSTLIRQRPPENDQADDNESHDDGSDGQGGESDATPKPRTRRKRVIPDAGETRGRKLHLPESVYERLQLLAIQRRATVSAVATDLLDRSLPKLRIERDA
jgi:hypothetical protein